MNISKIKEFINLRAELNENGVIGLDIWADRVHVRPEKIINHADLFVCIRPESKQYPYYISVEVDGIELHAILTTDQFEKYPHLKEKLYMEEDVQLDGMESEEIA